MIHVVWSWTWHSVMDPGNLLMSTLQWGVAALFGYFKLWRKHLKPHIARTKKLYDAMETQNDGHPA